MKGFDSYIRETFDIGDVDVQTYSPLTLAFIGDGIYDLIIRGESGCTGEIHGCDCADADPGGGGSL